MKAKKSAIIALILCLSMILASCSTIDSQITEQKSYQEKIDTIWDAVINDDRIKSMPKNPADDANYVVFISISDGKQQANVFTGTGKTLSDAWNTATSIASKETMAATWIKADIVKSTETITLSELSDNLFYYKQNFYRYGIAFDTQFQTAMLESELTANRVYNTSERNIDLNNLNTYLQTKSREPLETIPETVQIFQCIGYIYDETDEVYELYDSSEKYNRRKIDIVDKTYTEQIIYSSTNYLLEHLKTNGQFDYRFNADIDETYGTYNIVRHAGTIWSLICRYRMTPTDEIKTKIDEAIDYMISQVVYRTDNTAYLLESKNGELKLGANGLAVVALTEYMNVFNTDKHKEIACDLGNGILSLLDTTTGEFTHVLTDTYIVKDIYRTVYYDGEATFALCRLYTLTNDQIWLDAAKSAINHFIDAEYEQYCDHWVAYAMNEITKIEPNNQAYYDFAFRNAETNFDFIYNIKTAWPTTFELLMATFEIYQRAEQYGIKTNFNIDNLIHTIEHRAEWMLNGYLYPEYAMYIANPNKFVYTFYVRHDYYRVRIDDVQHNVGGYYLYYKNYDSLVHHGLWSESETNDENT